MIHTRRTWALPALALTLMLGACSTPDDLNAPELEPQFGTADDEVGFDVSFYSTGRIYALSERDYVVEDGYYDDYYEEYGDLYYESLELHRYDANGNPAQTSIIESDACSDASEYNYCSESPNNIQPLGLYTDSKSFVYVLFLNTSYDDVQYYVYKVDSTGNVVRRIFLGGYEVDFNTRVSAAVDASGNIYVGKTIRDYESSTDTFVSTGIVAKYSTSGTLLWQRTSTVGNPTNITVSSSGSVYVVGDKGIARYTNSGNFNWTKLGNFEEVMISGSNLYTRYRTNIFKFDGNGKQLWKRTQSGLTSPSFADMKGDGSGNVYLAGKYNASSTNRNAFIRKLNSSGSVLWTKTYGTSAYDDARAIATINGSEIYTIGETQGSLAHTNIGGSDAYLRKVNSSGNLVWTR
jgi:hypothetical protein